MIGCGSIARAHAVACRLLAEEGLVELAAVADPDAEAIRNVERIAGSVPRHVHDAGALTDDPEIDALLVLAPTRFHRDLILGAAAAGKPVFTEKPLAPRYETVREIVDAVETAAIPAQVGFQSRYHPIIRRLHELAHDGRHGAPMAYLVRDDQFWPTGGVVDGHTSWRSRAVDAGGGALLEHSIHSCDIACWLFGPVTRVYARTREVFGYDVEDAAALTIEHASGVIGTLLTIFNGVTDREERRIEIFFERAAVEATTDFVVDAPEDSLLVKTATDPVERVDTVALCRDTFQRDGIDPGRRFYVYQHLALRAFVHSLSARVPPTPDARDALRAHQVVEAAYRSASTGEPCDVATLDRT
jgi:predicted dehydrogenase